MTTKITQGLVDQTLDFTWTGDHSFVGITQSVLGLTGGGNLDVTRINQVRDGSTYTIPLANSVAADTQLVVELPERYKAFETVLQRSGSDTITDSNGTDTTITYGGTSFGRTYLTSDGVSNWSI